MVVHRQERRAWSLGIAAALMTLTVACGSPTGPTSQPSIIGGSEVPDEQQDARRWSTVALTTDLSMKEGQAPVLDAGHSFCSGTVIGERLILTAAHCIQKFDPKTRSKLPDNNLPKDSDFIVHFDTKVQKDGTWLRASKAIAHPDWDPNLTLSPNPKQAPHDIGLLVLADAIPSSARIAAIGDAGADLGDKIDLAGFGVSKSRNNNDTGILRQVRTSIKNVDGKANRIMVGAFGKGACGGDSGGPAYAMQDGQYVVVGATSTGAELFGRCLGLANYYTDVRPYRTWIEETAKTYL